MPVVSALPVVRLMLLLCVAIGKDLSRDPLGLRGKVALEVLEQAVDEGLERHDGEQFSLMTRENSIVTVKANPAVGLGETPMRSATDTAETDEDRDPQTEPEPAGR